MPDKNFLENFPLYRKITFGPANYPISDGQILKPSINMKCPICNSRQTYNMEGDFLGEGELESNIFRAQYLCAGCKKDVREFVLKFDRYSQFNEKKRAHEYYISICKIGQNPSWDIAMDEELEKILGGHAELYKKGLICESQGYGIGAYAYFRRITEEIIDKLLDSIEGMIDDKEKNKYAEALVKAKQTRITQDKINLVKDLLPNSLRPGGMNPLGVLHSSLSKGLHNGGDDECMDEAESIRNVLVFLVNQVIKVKDDAKKFTDGMKKLLDKRS